MLKKLLTEGRKERNRQLHLKNTWGHDLGGYCALTSGNLFLTLKEFNPVFCIANQTESDSHHSFLEIGQYCIDITAKQFSNKLPAVFICKKSVYRDFLIELGYEIESKAKSQEEIRENLAGWDDKFKPSYCHQSHKKIESIKSLVNSEISLTTSPKNNRISL